ncbi:hypothetical protein KV112_12060 [Mycolicibacter sp. MYC123]|uniref:Uncharacterized protein n=1 Tax=[Mycobacterium] zoologicum TaxID=2872311 RepID=A0ABU5YK88_9MYCO|nr:hypothetical protein [Mycolicibacter sp. MYC123]MEB3050463.1 hypothetical protein [Mycolicibacter sp. MYC123]
MTVAVDLGHRPENRAEQLKQLRRQMAAVAGKVGAGRRESGAAPAAEAVLPVPSLLAAVLPAGLPRGTVAVLSGARSLGLSMVAAVTAAGGNAAIVGQPDTGLLAAVEMGADLSRLAVIPDPGNDPVEVATVLMDGMDLVVLGLGGKSVPPARTRVVLARARHRGCALLVSGGAWQGAALQLEARVSGYETVGDKITSCGAIPGFGRIGAVRLEVRAAGRAAGHTRAG